MSELQDILRSIAPISQSLDVLDSLVSDQIKKIEVAMRCHFSISIQIPVNFACLKFGKLGGDWCLMVDGAPLLSCSRETRCDMLANHIEALIREGASQIKSRIEERELALATSQRILSDLEVTP